MNFPQTLLSLYLLNFDIKLLRLLSSKYFQISRMTLTHDLLKSVHLISKVNFKTLTCHFIICIWIHCIAIIKRGLHDTDSIKSVESCFMTRHLINVCKCSTNAWEECTFLNCWVEFYINPLDKDYLSQYLILLFNLLYVTNSVWWAGGDTDRERQGERERRAARRQNNWWKQAKNERGKPLTTSGFGTRKWLNGTKCSLLWFCSRAAGSVPMWGSSHCWSVLEQKPPIGLWPLGSGLREEGRVWHGKLPSKPEQECLWGLPSAPHKEAPTQHPKISAQGLDKGLEIKAQE